MHGLQMTSKTIFKQNCSLQQHGIFGARNNYATTPKHEDTRHGCQIDMILNKYELRKHPKTYWNTINQAWQAAIKLSRLSQNLGRQKHHHVAAFGGTKQHAYQLHYVYKDHGHVVDIAYIKQLHWSISIGGMDQ